MKVHELFEDDAVQRGHVAFDKKTGKWTAVNQQGLKQEFDSEEPANQYAIVGSNDIADESVVRRDRVLAESEMKKLKDNKKPLTPEERKEVMDSGAVWHHGPKGEETPAVWKSVDKSGKTTYITNTHRAYQTSPTIKGAIKKYAFIKTTA